MNDRMCQKLLFHMPVQRLQPDFTALDHPVCHGSTAQRNTFPCPDLLLPCQWQSVYILLRHNVCHGRGGCQRVLHERYRRFYGNDVRKAGILLTAVTGIGNCIVSQQLYLLWDDLHFVTEEFLANGFHLPTAFAAYQLAFRNFQEHLFFREIVQHLCLAAFLLPLMCLNKNGIRIGFFCLVVLRRFCLIEQAELVFSENIILLFTGLTEPSSLGIGKDLVHMLQLALQFVDFRFLLQDGFFQNSHFSSSICSFPLLGSHGFSS